MVTAPLAILSLAGSGVQAYGTIKAAEAEANSMREQANIERLVASEILYRAEVEQNLKRADLQQQLGDVVSQFAESKVDVSTGAPLLLMRDLMRVTNHEIAMSNREAIFESRMRELQAEGLQKAARDTETAGKIQALGQLLGGGARAASNFSGGATRSASVSRTAAPSPGVRGPGRPNLGPSLTDEF